MFFVVAVNHAESEGSKDTKTRLGFAGLKFGDYGSVEDSVRERAAEIAAVFAFSACANQDKVGVILASDQIEQFQKLSTSAGAVASALGSVASQVYSDDLKPAVSNLQTSMEFYTDYFLDLAEQSSDLAAVDTAVSNAETAATSAATITEICVGD